MRKQLARAGVVAVAAMMLTTTAFADGITVDGYTGLNEVQVTVPTVAGAETSLLAVTGSENATPSVGENGADIAYIDQGKTDSVVALADATTLTFTFNTEGPDARVSNGNIDVFSAYMGGDALASVAKVKEMAPAESIALTVNEEVTIPAGSNSDTIKGLLKDKATVAVTHKLIEGTAPSTIAVGSEDDVFTYAIDGQGIKATFDPAQAAAAKFSTVGDAAVNSAVVTQNVTIEAEPVVIETVSIAASDGTNSGDPVELRNMTDDTWDNDLVIERLKEKVVITASYTMTSGHKDPTPVTNNAQYVVTGGTGVTGDPYVITVDYSEDGKNAPQITLYAVKGTATSTVAISGKVETRDDRTAQYGVPTGRVLVSAYDPSTKAFVNAAITDASGNFTIEVPSADTTYTLLASYNGLTYITDSIVVTRIYNSAQVSAKSGESPVLQMTMTVGDTDGNGVVNAADTNAVRTNLPNPDFTTPPVE